MVVVPQLHAVAERPKGETRTEIASRIDGVACETSARTSVDERRRRTRERRDAPEIQPFDMPMATTTKPRTMAPSPAPGGALFCRGREAS